MAQDEREVDLYGDKAPYEKGARVYKTGSGYSGPGIVRSCFLGKDWHWRVVVEHEIRGGQGEFFHIYGKSQLRADRRVEEEHGDINAA